LRNPNAVGVAMLKPIIDLGNMLRIEIIQLKNHIETFIGFISIFLMLTARVAPIFPVFYWQYIRVKYVVNFFSKHSFKVSDEKIFRVIFPGFLYSIFIENGKKALFYFVNY
jgi:hypothetical protein